jgi:hypothetical protein
MYKVIFQNGDAFMTWHECLGHPRLVTMIVCMSIVGMQPCIC